MAFSLSFLPWVDALIFRRAFFSAGLRPYTADIDSETTLQCWISDPLNPELNPNPITPSPKPPLLLIHGFGPPSTWQWRHQVAPLSQHFDLIVPDLIFFGRSTTKSPTRSELFQAQSLISLLNALGLGQRNDISLVGTSYGGFVVYHMARLLSEERVRKVVIASSDLLKAEADDKAFMDRAGVEKISDVMIPREPDKMRILMGLAFHRPPRFLPDFILRDIIRNMYGDNIEEKMELIRGVTLGKKEEFQLTPLPQEVLIIWGEHDEIFPLNKAHEIHECLGGKAKLEILKDTGHLPQSEDPTRFNEVLINFLLTNSESTENNRTA